MRSSAGAALLILTLLSPGCQETPLLIRDVRDISDGEKKQFHWGEPDHGLRVGLAYDRIKDHRWGSDIVFRVVLENVSGEPIKVLDPEYYTGGILGGSSPLQVQLNGQRRGPALVSSGSGTAPLREYVELGAGESMAREAEIDSFYWQYSLKPPFTADVVYKYSLDGEGIGIVHKEQASWFEGKPEYARVPQLKSWFEDNEYFKVTGLWKGKIETGVVRIDAQ